REVLDARVADAVLAEHVDGAEEILVRRAVAARRVRDRLDHDLHRDIAGIAGAFAIDGEDEAADGFLADPTAQPPRAIGAEPHLALPDALHFLLHHVRRDAVDEAAAAAAALEREHEARVLGRAAVDARPHPEGTVVAADRRDVARVERELRVPHERAVG